LLCSKILLSFNVLIRSFGRIAMTQPMRGQANAQTAHQMSSQRAKQPTDQTRSSTLPGQMAGQRGQNLRRQAAQAFLESLNHLGETFKTSDPASDRNLDELK
jgi:hypothetical protein